MKFISTGDRSDLPEEVQEALWDRMPDGTGDTPLRMALRTFLADAIHHWGSHS